MLIKTFRDWSLEITQRDKTCCVDIVEIHESSEPPNIFKFRFRHKFNNHNNSVSIPLEALDEVIEFLQKVKLKVTNED